MECNEDSVSIKKSSTKSDTYKKTNTNKTRNWDTKNILRCNIISEKAAAYIYMIGMTIKYYETNQSRWEIIIIICTFILGAGGIPSLVIADDIETVRIVNGIIQGLLLTLGLLKTIYQWKNYKDTIKEFSWSYHKYADLYVKIETTLNTDYKKRTHFKKFYEEIQKKDFALQRKTPKIPDHIIKKYYKKMGDTALTQPVLFGTVNMIETYINNIDKIYDNKNQPIQTFRETEDIVKITYTTSMDLGTDKNNFKFNEDIILKKNYELDRFLNKG